MKNIITPILTLFIINACDIQEEPKPVDNFDKARHELIKYFESVGYKIDFIKHSDFEGELIATLNFSTNARTNSSQLEEAKEEIRSIIVENGGIITDNSTKPSSNGRIMGCDSDRVDFDGGWAYVYYCEIEGTISVVVNWWDEDGFRGQSVYE